MRIPGWLRETARPTHGPVPWAGMALGALAVGVPLAAGLAAGRVPPQPQLLRPPSFEQVSDTVRFVQEAMADTPLQPPEPQVPRSRT